MYEYLPGKRIPGIEEVFNLAERAQQEQRLEAEAGQIQIRKTSGFLFVFFCIVFKQLRVIKH